MSTLESAQIRTQPNRGIRFKRESLIGRIWENKQSYMFIGPFMITFLLFIVFPIVVAIGLSFFKFNALSAPVFVGWHNFLSIITQDRIFLQYAVPNTFKFAIIVGPIGYMMSFFLAWLIHQMPKSIRDYFTLAIYAPSFAGVI